MFVVFLHSAGGHKHGKVCQNLFLIDSHSYTYAINIKKNSIFLKKFHYESMRPSIEFIGKLHIKFEKF